VPARKRLHNVLGLVFI